MSKPITIPDTVAFYQILTVTNGKFMMLNNPDIMSSGLFATESEALQVMLMETIKTPHIKYQVFKIEWPTDGRQ